MIVKGVVRVMKKTNLRDVCLMRHKNSRKIKFKIVWWTSYSIWNQELLQKFHKMLRFKKIAASNICDHKQQFESFLLNKFVKKILSYLRTINLSKISAYQQEKQWKIRLESQLQILRVKANVTRIIKINKLTIKFPDLTES